MKLLIDTHLLLWWLDGSRQLSEAARVLIADPANTIFISAVTHWEIWIKVSLGKLDLPADFDDALGGGAFEALPFTAEHARAAGNLPIIHRDPFDRALVAQASLEGLTMVTSDAALAGYGSFVHAV